MCGRNLDFTLKKWIEIVKVLEYEVSQSSFLMCSNFVMIKALETHANILQIRFGLNLNLNTTPFYFKTLLNVSKDDAKQKISPKQATARKDKIEEKILQDMHKSIK